MVCKFPKGCALGRAIQNFNFYDCCKSLRLRLSACRASRSYPSATLSMIRFACASVICAAWARASDARARHRSIASTSDCIARSPLSSAAQNASRRKGFRRKRRKMRENHDFRATANAHTEWVRSRISGGERVERGVGPRFSTPEAGDDSQTRM
jgi:hypothetical protein